MTWRAFIIGLVAVAGVSLLDPYANFIKGYGGLTAHSFPDGAVLVLVLLSVGANVLIRAARRGWELARHELMLIWCMLIVSAAIPSEGIGLYWYSLIAGAPYLARRADVPWEENGALAYAPEGLVLSKDPRSVAAQQYYEGAGEGGRVPWRVWLGPLARWAVFLLLLYLAVLLLCAMLRRQWVDVERLMFPLARIPLEFTEEAGGPAGGWLPALFGRRVFLAGLAAAGALRLLRALPLFIGGSQVMPLTIPLQDVLQDTPLSYTDFRNFEFIPFAVGFAFLVPADVSLSVWFFFLFGRAELQAAHGFGLPDASGTYSPLMNWQQTGAHMAFALAMLVMARRHLTAVFRKALGLSGALDDSREPVSCRVAFWGFVACIAGCLAWNWHYGMAPWSGLAVLAVTFCAFMVYARMVAQSGLFVSHNSWGAASVVHGLSGGRALHGAGLVVASMQSSLLVSNVTTVLAPMAACVFRISEVIQRRRLLLPALLAAIVLAMACTTFTVLSQAYAQGALNFASQWGQTMLPKQTFDGAQWMISQPTQSARVHWSGFVLGAALTGFVTFMRTRFYWWPVHPIGLLANSTWWAQHLWFPFLVGWATKVGIMKAGGGRMLRNARDFFIAFIIAEAFVSGVSAIVRTVTGGAAPGF